VDVLNLFSRIKFIDNVVYKVQKLKNQIPRGHFFLLSKVDHFPVDSPANRPPLVLLNQHPPVKPEPEILLD